MTRRSISSVAMPGLSFGLFLGLYIGMVGRSQAQEMEPRAYSPTPQNLNFVGVAYTRTEGELLFDESVPLRDVDAKIDSVALIYGQTFGLLNRPASLTVLVPYVSGDIAGDVLVNVGTVGMGYQQVHRAGFADAHLRFGLNLLGGPSFTASDSARRTAKTSVGVSLNVIAPTGKYDSSKAINIGNNRWAFKTELGVSQPVGRWTFDAGAGVWFFTTNDDFFNGSKKRQDPMPNVQGHVSYSFARGFWLAAGAAYFWEGQSTVDGRKLDDRKSNTKVGVVLTIPATDRQSIKLAWSTGARVRVGGDFDAVGIAWQYVWPD